MYCNDGCRKLHKRNKVFFLSCRFCVGDRFYLFDNKVLCEYDYEERLSFQNVPFPGHNPNSNASTNNSSTPGGSQTTMANSNNSSSTNMTANTANNAGHPPSATPPGSGNNSLQRLKRHTLESLPVQDDASSGYGSPDSLLSDGK